MLESLSDKFEAIFKKLRGEARVRESHLEETLREVRLALLEADVNVEVVKQFTEAIRRQALGEDVLQSLTPGQQIIKIVHQELIRLMGEEGRGLDLSASPPVPVMLVGLQGSGKTTTVAKLARYLKLEKSAIPTSCRPTFAALRRSSNSGSSASRWAARCILRERTRTR